MSTDRWRFAEFALDPDRERRRVCCLARLGGDRERELMEATVCLRPACGLRFRLRELSRPREVSRPRDVSRRSACVHHRESTMPKPMAMR